MTIEEEPVDDAEGENSEAGLLKKDPKTYCWGFVKKRTLLVIWGTISVTLTNFGYFSGGHYAFNYFQREYFGV